MALLSSTKLQLPLWLKAVLISRISRLLSWIAEIKALDPLVPPQDITMRSLKGIAIMGLVPTGRKRKRTKRRTRRRPSQREGLLTWTLESRGHLSKYLTLRRRRLARKISLLSRTRSARVSSRTKIPVKTRACLTIR